MARFRSATTVVWGMSEGGSIWKFAEDGVSKLAQAEIKWDKRGLNTYWDKSWLIQFSKLSKIYQDDEGCLVPSMPGADLVIYRSEKEEWNPRIPSCGYPLNYTSVPEKALKKVQDIIPPREIYSATGVHVKTFQPWAQIQYMLDMGWDFEDARIESIVPLGDLISLYITNGGAAMHAPSMYKSQGLGAKNILEKLFPDFWKKIASWPPWKLGDSFGGVYPCDHDSVYSRLIGFLLFPWVLWTGSWLGVARFMDGLSILPSQKTYHAGIAFEGADWTEAAITNTGMFGPIYKALLKIANLSYGEVWDAAKGNLDKDITVDLKIPVLVKDPHSFASWIVSRCYAKLKGQDYKLATIGAIISFVRAVARVCVQDLKNIAYALDLELPNQIAITGGWAENELFLVVLRSLGIWPKVPYFAENATHAGAAAFGLSEGAGFLQFCEAVEMIESWARKSK